MKLKVVLPFIAVLLVVLGTVFIKSMVETASLDENTGKPTATITESSISLEVELDKAEYKVGEVVMVEMTLTNIGSEIVTLTFLTSQIFDFSVEGIDAEFSYVWSSDKVFLQVITERALKPGQFIRQDLEWIPSGPGTYAITGYTVSFQLDENTLQLKTQPITLKVTK
jgi:hypothetical protein